MGLEKCLYINFSVDNHFGGGKYNETILELIKEIFQKTDVYFFSSKMTRWCNLKNTLNGFLNGMDIGVVDDICQIIENENYDWVFIASSNFGKLSWILRKRFPKIKICVLFNNIEFNFILSQISCGFRPQLLLTLCATYLSELKVVKSANKVIVLNDREKNALRRIYGRLSDAVIPIVLRDEYAEYQNVGDVRGIDKVRIGVFVGSNFYANNHAVKWFAKNVAPFTPDVYYEIVGKGFENEKFLECENFKIVGTVDNLKDYYEKADFIIAPIFKGAGMKVKVAEAMMYGKTIIGTPEAFEGYTDVLRWGKVCTNAREFIDTINEGTFITGFNVNARAYFLKLYEYKAVKNKLINTFKDENEE